MDAGVIGKWWTMTCSAMLIVAAPAGVAAQSDPGAAGSAGPAWSPYLVGALLGVLSMLTFYFSNKPLGASTAYARAAGLCGQICAARHTRSLPFFQEDKQPKIDWQVMLVTGVVAGSFLAAWSGSELTGRWLPPMWLATFGDRVWLRLLIAFAGGLLMAFGARVAGGCTSGHGISGALQLSVGSWIALACFFVGGVVTAMTLYQMAA
jgi:uncharacterized protein